MKEAQDNKKEPPEIKDWLFLKIEQMLEKRKPLNEYTKEELESIWKKVFSEEFFQEIAEGMKEKIQEYESDTIKGIRVDHAEGVRKIQEIWGNAFDLMWLFVNISNETAIMYESDVKSSISNENRFMLKTLFLLHKRGCVVASEIITLLANGYSEGAYARWRTLHEINITAHFIVDQGNDIAKRYLAYDLIGSYKNIEQYQRYCEKLGKEPMTDGEKIEYEVCV